MYRLLPLCVQFGADAGAELGSFRSVCFHWRATEGDVDVVSSVVTTETIFLLCRLEDTCKGAWFSCWSVRYLTSTTMAVMLLGRCSVYHQWMWDWSCWLEVVEVQSVAGRTSPGLPAYRKCLPPPHVPLSHTVGNLKVHFCHVNQ